MSIWWRLTLFSPGMAALPCRRAGLKISPNRCGAPHRHDGRRHNMPVQRFAPMTKDFATFDCDAHVTEPPLIWERAKDFLTRDERDALKATIWWDSGSQLPIVNGRAGIGLDAPREPGITGTE